MELENYANTERITVCVLSVHCAMCMSYNCHCQSNVESSLLECNCLAGKKSCFVLSFFNNLRDFSL